MEDLPVHDLLPNRDLLDGTIADQDYALRDLQVARRHHRASIQALKRFENFLMVVPQHNKELLLPQPQKQDKLLKKLPDMRNNNWLQLPK
jgi:hypothetical protein